MTRLLIIIAILFLCSSCAMQPNYHYTPQSADPMLILHSDFYEYTAFHVQIDQEGDNKIKFVGYVLHQDSILRIDRPNKEIKIYVPANKEVVIHSYYGASGGYCGPIVKAFIPEKSKTYLVTMKRHEHSKNYIYCNLIITDADRPGLIIPTTSLRK